MENIDIVKTCNINIFYRNLERKNKKGGCWKKREPLEVKFKSKEEENDWENENSHKDDIENKNCSESFKNSQSENKKQKKIVKSVTMLTKQIVIILKRRI